jgi:two-component system nitrogen regulation response regulator NtrX
LKSVLYLGCPTSERADAEKLLGTADVSVVWADSAAYALGELQRRDLPVLLDLSRGATALQHAREIRAHRASTLMFAVVDARRPELTIEALLTGMADVFARPLGGRRVANAIERELEYESCQQGKTTGVARKSGADLYGHSIAMRDVLALIARAATMRAGVLIRGEKGTGRQIAARAIHDQQAEPGGAFLAIDCATINPDQMDVDLFGVPGRAVTDSGVDGLEFVSRNSRLYEARGGTVYLRHLAELPARVQRRLARVLRDREVLLVETGQAVGLDVRPIAGVDPGFDGAVAEGRIRDDLFRRLSVIAIDMPPLRSRREDIPALTNYFLRETCASLRVPPRTLSRAALLLIAALPWHGNAMELRVLLEGLVTGVPAGRGIGIEDVLAHVRLDGGSSAFTGGGSLKQARVRFEREYITAVLEQHQGRISEAAKTLGIQRTNLYRKLRSLPVARATNRGRRS